MPVSASSTDQPVRSDRHREARRLAVEDGAFGDRDSRARWVHIGVRDPRALEERGHIERNRPRRSLGDLPRSTIERQMEDARSACKPRYEGCVYRTLRTNAYGACGTAARSVLDSIPTH